MFDQIRNMADYSSLELSLAMTRRDAEITESFLAMIYIFFLNFSLNSGGEY